MIYIFIEDPGHRVDTPGKNDNGLHEYEFNEDVARRLEKKLEKYGEVHFTIDTKKHPYSELTAAGRSQNLNSRTSKANQIYYDAIKKYGEGNFKIILISIHANAFENPNISGYEVFVWRYGLDAHELAKKVHKQAQLIMGVGTTINDRKIKEGNFAILRNTKMPAILIEHEFYTNRAAVLKLKDNTFRDKCTDHIFKGILEYMGIGGNEVSKIDELENRIITIEKHLNIFTEVEEEKEESAILIYTRPLKFGTVGEDVKQLQIRLKELGFYISSIDGSFGPAMDKAVRAYQSANSLAVDGSVGPATIRLLNGGK